MQSFLHLLHTVHIPVYEFESFVDTIEVFLNRFLYISSKS